jgi:hypothetical protein
MSAFQKLILSLLLVPMLGACGVSMRSGSHFPQGSISGPLTFAWSQAGDRVTGDPRLQNNPFFEERLHEAIEWELSMRGIRRVDGAADLSIHHHLSMADHELIDEAVDESGHSRQQVLSYTEGTVVVHIVDNRTGRDVWLGWAQANMEPALQGPEQMRRWVYGMVKEMFRRWPLP